MTSAELEKKGVKDFQLDYAIKTLKRLARSGLYRLGRSAEEVAVSRWPKRSSPARRAVEHCAGGVRRGSIALLLPLALLGGALGSQYLGGLHPCEMCYWQRWPHAAAILLAALAFTAPANQPRSRTCHLLAALAIAISGAIGVYHAGVEAKIFEGFTTCTAIASGREHVGAAEADHARAADPLRPGPVPLPRHLDGRLERDPVARRRGADPAPAALKPRRA